MDPRSFMNYKRDRRNMLDQSQIQSEDQMEVEEEEMLKLRLIMKYRLYGRDGITDKEFDKLKHYVERRENGKEEYVVRRKPDYDDQLWIMNKRDQEKKLREQA